MKTERGCNCIYAVTCYDSIQTTCIRYDLYSANLCRTAIRYAASALQLLTRLPSPECDINGCNTISFEKWSEIMWLVFPSFFPSLLLIYKYIILYWIKDPFQIFHMLPRTYFTKPATEMFMPKIHCLFISVMYILCGQENNIKHLLTKSGGKSLPQLKSIIKRSENPNWYGEWQRSIAVTQENQFKI